MAKIFMIDSENVGASWIQLLPALSEEDQIFVFYTDKSPYVSYENMLQVIKYGNMPVFIKCFEGTNALDFQLVSEMGYKLCENPEGEFIIISDDYGYDAAVKYWMKKGYNIRRIGKKGCKYQSEAALRMERREFVPVEMQSQPEKTEPTQAATYQAMVQQQTAEVASHVEEGSANASTAEGSNPNDNAVSGSSANLSSANGGAFIFPSIWKAPRSITQKAQEGLIPVEEEAGRIQLQKENSSTRRLEGYLTRHMKSQQRIHFKTQL